ncbi:MAG: cell division protein FtsA [Deltaproteobacteria bacterium]|jgi:cell division protein FtsA|nr:cell division protein FtsA [Deltaproteobacteria bacterium]
MSSENEETLVALDIGSTKICCLVASPKEDGTFDIKGMGLSRSAGLKNGRVSNIQAATKAIKEAVKLAEENSELEIGSAFIGIAGEHISGEKVVGSVNINGGVVTESHIQRAIENALQQRVPSNLEILSKIPIEFTIDQRENVNPKNMHGQQLRVTVHVFYVSGDAMGDLTSAVTEAGVDINDVYLQSVVSAESVLNNDEKEQGVVLLDIGGGSCDMAVILNGSVQLIHEIPIGGEALTHDLTTALITSYNTAEKIKINHGFCYKTFPDEDFDIEFPNLDGVTTSTISASLICQVLYGRIEALFGQIALVLANEGYNEKIKSIVLTGGTSHLRGLAQSAKEYFNCHVRVGGPICTGSFSDTVDDPIYATAVGLIMYGASHHNTDSENTVVEKKPGFFARLFKKLFGKSPKK